MAGDLTALTSYLDKASSHGTGRCWSPDLKTNRDSLVYRGRRAEYHTGETKFMKEEPLRSARVPFEHSAEY